jgi:CRISPR-associated protein Cas1
MRKLLNTLFVTSPASYLTKDGENVIIQIDNEEKMRLPIHTLEGIVCFGYAGASPALMSLCAKRGVGLSFHNEYGKFLARVSGEVQGNVLLRKKQYKVSEDETIAIKIARNCIQAKVLNCRNVIQRALRDHSETVDITSLEDTSCRLLNSIEQMQKTDNIDSLRGIEGDAARHYFSIFDELILKQKEDFYMESRNKRPPKDFLNALLSFLYTMLAHDVQSALETVGLDPYVGFLHKDRPGRASLALDLMEELRPVLADRMVLSLVNRQQIKKNGFTVKENGAVLMDDDTRKEVLQSWHKRKQEEIIHPFLKEKIKIGLIPYVQAMLLARYLRGDLDGYPAFIWK